jgi:hypothetical protein
MPLSLDHITQKKLVFVTQLYQRALLQAQSQHSYVDRVIAVIEFDLTIETVLKIVVLAFDASKTPAGDFQGIVSQADGLLIKAGFAGIPDKAKIQQVRTIRNDAQHKARYPNESDVSDIRTYTRDFLTQLLVDVWGIRLEELSLVSAIANAPVKGHLMDAQADLSKAQYTDSVIKTILGFERATGKVRAAIAGLSRLT